MSENELLTIVELADILKLSKHTIQAWVSPSSPNHRPEFANLVRHAGRKTVFYKHEVLSWLEQRKGPIYSQELLEISPYWKEKFIKSRGLLKGLVKPIVRNKQNLGRSRRGIEQSSTLFAPKIIALDTEPLLIWLTDSTEATAVLEVVEKAESIMLSAVLINWLLSKAIGKENYFYLLKDFLLEQNIFTVAPLNEQALRNLWDSNFKINDMSFLIYYSCNAAKADYLFTTNKTLLQGKSLSLLSL